MKTTITKEEIKKIVEIYFKARNIGKTMSFYEYSGLRNFVSKNTRGDFEKVSNEKLMNALNNLNIEVKR